MAFEQALQGILESALFRVLIANSSLGPNPADFVPTNPVTGPMRVTNIDNVQVFCTSSGNVSSCTRVNAPSPKRAPQQVQSVAQVSSYGNGGVSTVNSRVGNQGTLQSMVTAHDNNPSTFVQQPISGTLGSSLFGQQATYGVKTPLNQGNPFAFLFR